jgi:uncharacterized protein (TIGR04255 family)
MPGSHYRRNFLSRVLLRVDHDNLPSAQESAIADRIRDHFPVVAGIPIGTLTVNVTPTASGIQQNITGMQWEHRKVAGGTKILFSTPDHLSLEYGKDDFDHFPPFRAEFEAGFNALAQVYPEIHVTRIGLRYVNLIRFDEGNPLDWDGIIKAELVSAVKAGMQRDAEMARSMHQLHTKRSNVSAVLTYGINNPEYPAVVSRRQFVLDIDSHRSELIPHNEVLPTITSLNEMCEATFEQSIDDGLRRILEPIND